LFNTTLVPAVEKDSLLRALAAGIARLLEESEQVAALAAKAEPHLRELAAKG
jgi:hypothetical protein